MIYLLRHGTAEDGAGKPDSERELTDKGRGQARAAGRALRVLEAGIETCLASPLVRARDTAALACSELGIEVEICPELGGGPFDPQALTAGRGTTLLVGHEPSFSGAVAALTGAHVKMRKGGVAVVDGRVLGALLRPKDLREIG